MPRTPKVNGPDRLTTQEVRALLVRLHAPETTPTEQIGIRNCIVMRHLPLASSVARKLTSTIIPLEDRVQVCLAALLEAVEKADPLSTAAFTTFATKVMRNALLQAATQYHLVPTQFADVSRVQQTFTRLKGELGRDPTAEEIATAARITPNKYHAIMAAQFPTTDLVEADGAQETFAAPDAGLTDRDNRRRVQALLDAAHPPLTAEELLVLKLRFGLGVDRIEHSVKEIAVELNLSLVRSRQISDQALKKIKSGSRNVA